MRLKVGGPSIAAAHGQKVGGPRPGPIASAAYDWWYPPNPTSYTNGVVQPSTNLYQNCII